jgi:hypothetical protein
MGCQPARCMHKCYDLVLHGSSHFCPIFFFSSFLNSNDVLSPKSRWKFNSFEAQSRVTSQDSHSGDFPMSISVEICFIVQFGMFVTLSNCVCMVQVFSAWSECSFSLWALKDLQKCLPCLGPKTRSWKLLRSLCFHDESFLLLPHGIPQKVCPQILVNSLKKCAVSFLCLHLEHQES